MTERELFEAWAAERWGTSAWRHTSNCCGEWDAWTAGMEQERMATAELREIATLAHRAEWDEDGEAETLAAAAEDADEWMALIERLHNEGRGPWKFSDATSLERLRGCRRALRRFLTPNVKVSGGAEAPTKTASGSPSAGP